MRNPNNPICSTFMNKTITGKTMKSRLLLEFTQSVFPNPPCGVRNLSKSVAEGFNILTYGLCFVFKTSVNSVAIVILKKPLALSNANGAAKNHLLNNQ